MIYFSLKTPKRNNLGWTIYLFVVVASTIAVCQSHGLTMPGELVRETKEKIFGDIKVVTCRTGIQGYRDGARIKFFREGRSGAWRKMYTTDVTYEAASPSFQVVEAVDDLNGVPVPIACADINGTGAPNFLIREETGEGVSCCIKYHLIYLGIDIRLISLNQPAI